MHDFTDLFKDEETGGLMQKSLSFFIMSRLR